MAVTEQKIAVEAAAESRLELLSREVMEAERQTKENLRGGYYIRLAEEADGQRELSEPFHEEVRQEIQAMKKASSNLRRAYLGTAALADELEVRLGQAGSKRRRRRTAAPANSVIDMEEEKTRHFAQGINFYKLALVCVIGSFAGVIVEMLWCLVWNGYLESRRGLVYGPFNLLYGIGALVLTLLLYKYRNRSWQLSFLGGMVVGSAVEYVCSWAQEMTFGSRSWDYSNMPFNLNGRICLQYAVFWGILGVFWIKDLYPRMAKLILRLPNRAGKILTWAMVAFLIVNSIVTLTAVFRWSERLAGEEPSNAVEELIDRRFPDERMERIFANMEFS